MVVVMTMVKMKRKGEKKVYSDESDEGDIMLP